MPLARCVASKYFEMNPTKKDDIISIAYLTLIRCVKERATMYNDNLGARINRKVRFAVLRFLIEDQAVFVPACTKKSINVISLSNGEEEIQIASRETISIDLKERLEKVAHTDLDRKIIDLRIQGYRDHEIAEQTGYTRQRISQFRKIMCRRFYDGNLRSKT